MKHMRKFLSIMLVICMLITLIPSSALAEEVLPETAVEEITDATTEEISEEAETTEVMTETASEEEESTVEVTEEEIQQEEGTEAVEETEEIESEISTFSLNDAPALAAAQPLAVTMDTITKTQSVPLDTSKFYTIFHLDCGRNYFSVQQIKNIIDEMAKDGYNTLELAVGNDALRLVLDDMSVTANGTTYDSTTITNALKSGNSSYRNNGTNELTQSEMDTIIAYANNKNIAIIPLVNAPGHANTMLAIMKAVGISNPAYNSDPRTIDVRNAEAVNFSLALVNKYIQYFASKGCKIFNMGADEYANTSYSSGSMGFGHLQSAGEYGYYADYVNNMAAQIQNAGMTAMAFNDGIYFNSKTTSTFDSNIAIAYWTSGWGSYLPMPAADLAEKCHKIINTNDAWYYVVGRDTGDTYSYVTATNGVKNTKVTDIPGSNDPKAYGAMMCLWYDYSATYNESKILTLLSTLAENNASYFEVTPETPEDTDVYEMTDESGKVTINTEAQKVNLTSLTATPTSVSSIDTDYVAYDVTINDGGYTDAAKVTIPLTNVLKEAEKLTGFVVNADSSITKVAGKKSEDGDSYSFICPHFSVVGVMAEEDSDADESADEIIEIFVGDDKEIKIADYNYAGRYTPSPAGIATVTVTGQDKEDAADTETAVTSVTSNTAYYIKNSSGQYLKADATWTTNRADAVKWTWTGTYLTYKSGNTTRTLRYNNGWTYVTGNSNRTTLYFNDGTFYRTRNNVGSWYSPSYTYSNPLGQPITVTKTDGHAASTTITFTGVSAGTTYVTIGGTKYKVIVSKKKQDVTVAVGDTTKKTDVSASSVVSADTSIVTATGNGSTVTFTGVSVGTTTVETDRVIYNVTVTAEDLSKVDPLTIDWWITNYPITSTDPNHTPDASRTDNSKTVYSTKLAASVAYGENGVAMADVVPATGKFEYSGADGCVFWKGTHLTSSNKQTGAGNVDQTAVDDAATYIRYFNKKWQYSADRQTWKDIASTDQMVAYYLQATKVTKEVTTMTKDWGLAVGKQDGSTSQVALSVAVVYPDGTLSPAEGDIYLNSTLIFNYWANRDIGIVAPVINDDYEVEKMTVTPGSRVSGKSGIFTTDSTDGINWEKKTTAAGTQWFNETTYWDETTGGTPMVNGATSNIKWSAANKAYLVLIYLKPVHHDTNLTVKWVDDSTATTINSQEVVVDYTGYTAPTFITHIVNNGKTGAPAGPIDLKDDAYIVNKAGVNQTFNKDLTVMPNIPDKYTTGLYKYISADISTDGKTLTLHYTFDTDKLDHRYIVDFGLPVKVSLKDLGIINTTNITSVVVSDNASYENEIITYTPSKVLTGTETVDVTVEYKKGEPTKLTIGFMPATTVYYEEGFAEYTGFSGGSKGTGNQTTSAVKGSKAIAAAVYGYDAKYASESAGPSNGTEAVSNTKGDVAEFTFKGTGVDIYTNNTTSSGNLTIKVSKDGSIVKLATVRTKMLNGESLATTGQNVNAYSTPIYTISGLSDGKYTVKITHSDDSRVSIDGFRVHGTIDVNDQVYVNDLEDNPNYLELRNTALKAFGVSEEGTKTQVYNANESADETTVVLITEGTTATTNMAADILANGPKNELYLMPEQVVKFKVSTSRQVQLGLKTVNEATEFTLNGTTKTISTSTDMFYSVISGDITIKNTGSGVLSITKIKVCDEPVVLAPLSEEDIQEAVDALYASPEPSVETADSTLSINMVDYAGKKLASTSLTQNGVVGETATFTAEEIADAAKAVLPSGYGMDASSIKDVEVAYGEDGSVNVLVGKVATLIINYKKGKTLVGTSTLTAIQKSSSKKYTFSTSEIKAACPAGYSVISIVGTSVNYGSSKTITGTCK